MPDIVMQVIIWLIVIGAFLVQRLFMRADEGELRDLIIFLFRAIMWRAGIVGVYYLIENFNRDIEVYHPMIRVVSNIPLCFAIGMFYFYIKKEINK